MTHPKILYQYNPKSECEDGSFDCYPVIAVDSGCVGLVLLSELETVIKIGVEGQREINRKLTEENKALKKEIEALKAKEIK